jgi:hypothetical protein
MGAYGVTSDRFIEVRLPKVRPPLPLPYRYTHTMTSSDILHHRLVHIPLPIFILIVLKNKIGVQSAISEVFTR